MCWPFPSGLPQLDTPSASDGNTETRTMFLERRATLLEHVFTLALCWERWEMNAAVVFCHGSVVSGVRYL